MCARKGSGVYSQQPTRQEADGIDRDRIRF
jgi:hypothetical protein